MIKIYGKIESLKKIRSTLEDHGVTEFNSVGEINAFLKYYNAEVRRIRKEARLDVTRDHEQLEKEKVKLGQDLIHLKELIAAVINDEIAKLDQRITSRECNKSKYIFQRIVNKSVLFVLKYRRRRIEKSRQKRINNATATLILKTENIKTLLKPYTENKEGIIDHRILPQLSIMEYTKGVLEDINPLIAGAIGESKVEKELKDLSVDGVLINDYSVNFNPPIYNKHEKERIYSIQIDHLMITRAGIFVLETKNWSKKSIERLDLRSPVAQVKRSSYAMLVLVNSVKNRSMGIKQHHWGERQVPVESLIVMIGQKPKEKFKYVKVKTLAELNGYIEHFEPIFSNEEVENISQFLLNKQGDNFNQRKKMGKSKSFSRSLFNKASGKSINDRYKNRWS